MLLIGEKMSVDAATLKTVFQIIKNAPEDQTLTVSQFAWTVKYYFLFGVMP